MANETTTKFKVDISELKKGIQEANRQIKLAYAEFKAAASGMDNWQKSTEGISKKIDSLDKVLAGQKTVLKSYESQLELITKEYGENSKEADEMRIKIANQQTAVNNTERAIRDFKEQLSELQKAQEQSSDAVKEQISEYDKLKNKISDQETNLKTLKSEYANVVLEQGKNSDSAKELASKIEELSGELNENKTKLNAAETAADEFDDTLDDLDETAKKTTNGGLSVFAVALGNLVANVISSAIDKMKELISTTFDVGISFDTSMSQVAAVSGATTEEIQLLRDKAKEMGSTTKFTASEAADAFNYMAMAGWKTEDMMEGIEGILNLAAASGAELGETSDIVTDALTAFGYSAKEAGRFADVMASAASNANTNVEMMGASFKYVAPVAGSMGYSIEDVAVALGLMANSGIKADMAGTSLRNLMQRMAKPTDEVEMAMNTLGVSLQNDSGEMNSLMDIMLQLRGGFGNLKISSEEFTKQCEELDGQLEEGSITQKEYDKQLEELTNRALGAEGAEKARAAAMLGGARAMSGLLAISNASEEDFNKLTKAINNSEGAAKEMADTMLDNLGGDMTLLKSKFEGLQLSVYEKMQPTLRKGAEALDKLLDKAEKGINWAIKNLPKVEAAITGIVTALITFQTVSAIQGIVKAWQAYKAATEGATVAQWLLNAAMGANPIGILISLLAGLVAAFIVLWNKSDEFREFWIDLWGKIKKTAQPIIDGISKWFSDAWKNIKKVWNIASSYFEKIFNEIWGKVKPIIDSIVGAFREAWELIKVVWDLVQPYFQERWNSIKAIFAVAKAVLKGCFETAWIAIKGVWDVVSSYFETIWKNIKTTFSVVKTFLTGYFRTAWEGIKLVWNASTGYFKAIWDTIKNVFSVVKDVLTGNWKDAWEGIKAIVNTWVSYFSGVWDGIKNVFGSVKTWFSDTFEAAWKAVKTVFSNWGDFFKGLWDTIKDTFSSLGTSISNAISESLVAGINAILITIENAMNDAIRMINKALKAINKIPGVHVSKLEKLELPRLERGGILKKGQVGILEGSGSEAVIPLDNNKKWIAATARDLKANLVSEGILGKGNPETVVNNNYTFNQTNNSPKALNRLSLYRQTKNQLALARTVKGG